MALWNRNKLRQRRVDPRRLRGEGLRGQVLRAMSLDNMARLSVTGLFFVAMLLLINLPREPVGYRLGQTVTSNIFARVDFKYEDEQATAKAREEARRLTPNVYVRDYTQALKMREDFRLLLEAAQDVNRLVPPPPPAATMNTTATSATVTPGATAPAMTSAPATSATPAATSEAAPSPAEAALAAAPGEAATATVATAQAVSPAHREVLDRWNLGKDFAELRRLATEPKKVNELVAGFDNLLAYVRGLPILSHSQHAAENMGQARTTIYIYDGQDYQLRDKAKLLDDSDRPAFGKLVRDRAAELFPPALLSDSLRGRLTEMFVTTRALNLVKQDNLTQAKSDEAAARVERVAYSVRGGDLLVGPDTVIERSDYLKLQAEHGAYLAQVKWWQHLETFGGSVILVGLLVALISGYAVLARRTRPERSSRGVMIGLLFLSVMIGVKVFYAVFHQNMIIFSMTIAALVMAIAYSRQFALGITWLAVLVLALVARLGVDEVLLLIIGTGLAILQLGEVRSRSKLIRVGFVTGLIYFLAVWGLALWNHEVLWQSDSWRSLFNTLETSLLAFGSGLLAGFIILGTLPFIEKIFGVVTNIRLLELCDVNQPALQLLNIRAPGTYSHSLLLGSLVEPAAEAIGANGLLARVGAYFHDIGKVTKPQYFTENWNQLVEATDHSHLTPQMSKLIITGHIKDGLEIIRQYDVPPAIDAFVAEHHGTTVIEYFYHEARKSAAGEVADTEFRYSGPRPQSRETAILMLADGCEGAVRSIKELTPSSIEDKVHEIIMKRLLDGQLNESGMSLNDVWAVEQSLKKSLISVYHGRIAYPATDPDQAADLAEAEAALGPEQSGGRAAGHDQE